MEYYVHVRVGGMWLDCLGFVPIRSIEAGAEAGVEAGVRDSRLVLPYRSLGENPSHKLSIYLLTIYN
jgi:hypothetical protein